jgi:indole-3-glycerol phosphate synthase
MARQQVSVPVLRKDFLIDRYQILESVVLGCDAALLIAAILDDQQLADFIAELEQYKVDPLVEVHTKEELERALQAKAKTIGINNRNLNTMKIDMEISARLMKKIPSDIVVVADVYDRLRVPVTGYFTGEEIEGWYAEAGYADIRVTRRVRNTESFRGLGVRR